MSPFIYLVEPNIKSVRIQLIDVLHSCKFLYLLVGFEKSVPSEVEHILQNLFSKIVEHTGLKHITDKTALILEGFNK